METKSIQTKEIGDYSSWLFLKSNTALAGASEGGGGGGGDVCSLANYSVAYEETQSNRFSVFRDFVSSLFPKAILFDFYFIKSVHMQQSNLRNCIRHLAPFLYVAIINTNHIVKTNSTTATDHNISNNNNNDNNNNSNENYKNNQEYPSTRKKMICLITVLRQKKMISFSFIFDVGIFSWFESTPHYKYFPYIEDIFKLSCTNMHLTKYVRAVFIISYLD